MRYDKLWLKEISSTADYLLYCYNVKITNFRLFIIEKKINTCLLNIRSNYIWYIKRNKIDDNIKVIFYPLSDIKEDKYNFGRRYKMYEGNKKEISLRDLCDQFIHADIFSQFIPMTEGSLGIYFASDKIKNQGLFYIQMYEIARILRSIAKSCNISIQVKYDEEKSVFKFSEI